MTGTYILREGSITKLVIKDTYTTFGRALVMPNLKPIFKPDQAEVQEFYKRFNSKKL